MRAYVGHVGYAGLRNFAAEDALPAAVLGELVRGLASAATAVLALLSDSSAEEIRRLLTDDRPHSACAVLLNQATKIVPLRLDVQDTRART